MKALFTFEPFITASQLMNKKEKYLLELITTNSREAVILHSQTLDDCTAEMAIVLRGRIYTVHHKFTGYNLETRMLTATVKITDTTIIRASRAAEILNA